MRPPSPHTPSPTNTFPSFGGTLEPQFPLFPTGRFFLLCAIAFPPPTSLPTSELDIQWSRLLSSAPEKLRGSYPSSFESTLHQGFTFCSVLHFPFGVAKFSWRALSRFPLHVFPLLAVWFRERIEFMIPGTHLWDCIAMWRVFLPFKGTAFLSPVRIIATVVYLCSFTPSRSAPPW